MASSWTASKFIEKPANGDDVNTWDVPINADFDVIDAAFGGTTTLNVTGQAGVVSLTAAQYRPPMITVTGTLTSNVNYQFPTNAGGNVSGVWSVINNATGNFTVTFSSVGAGTTVVVPASGARTVLQCDGTNVVKGAAASGANWDITSLNALGLTGILKGQGASAPVIVATAGTDYIAPGSNNTFTGTQTFSGTSSVLAAVLTDAAEVATVSATAATGTVAYYISSQSVLYFTSNAAANWTVNLTFSAGTTLNTALSTGQSITCVFLVTQGGTPYYNTTVQVDGATLGVTTKWQGAAPAAGVASSINAYTYSIIKTGNATFTVLGSVTAFA